MTFASVDERTFCAVHPSVETALRCNKCGRYMCVKCAVPTPVGYRCKQCVHEQQDVFFTATTRDYIVSAVAAFVLTLPLAFILKQILFLTIILGIPAGGLIGEVAFRVAGRRRGRYLWAVVGGAILLGTLIVTFTGVRDAVELVNMINQAGVGGRGGSELVTQVIVNSILPAVLFVVFCAGGAIARLRYGK